MGINQTRRIVLSGVPGSGKTTVLSYLENLGYHVFYEYSRELIQKSLDEGSDVLPWQDLNQFTKEVTVKRIEQYQRAFSKEINFYDRGIIDSAAYFLVNEEEIPEYLDNAIKFHPYQKPIFLFPFWREIYEVDSQRQENREEVERLHDAFIEVCERYKYPYIEVPKTTTEERAKFIIENVQGI